MPGTLHWTHRGTAPRERRGRKEGQGPQGEKGDKARADSGTGGYREGGFVPRRQHSEQQQELQQEGRDEKIALQNLLEDERLTTRDLRQGLKKAESTIAYCNTRLSAIESGSKDKDAVRNDLQLKLTAAAAAEAISATKWERERQQLRDEID